MIDDHGLDYDLIVRTAKRLCKRIPTIDYRDLAQESYMKQLAGRKSLTGPMQDYLRKPIFFGRDKNMRYVFPKKITLRDDMLTENPEAAYILTLDIEREENKYK